MPLRFYPLIDKTFNGLKILDVDQISWFPSWRGLGVGFGIVLRRKGFKA
jgi:hypothetical protein